MTRTMRGVNLAHRWAMPAVLFAGLVWQAGNPSGLAAIDFPRLENSVIKELNEARTRPRSYASHLKALRKYFHGKELRRPGQARLLTKEGVVAVDEAIRFLERTKPASVLRRSQGMSQGARDHVEAQRRSGEVGHGPAGGGGPSDRVNRYGSWEKASAENISYGPSGARDIVVSLIVDDGVPGRGHRQNIFNPDFHVVGTACGPHAVYGTMCVIDFAGEYREKGK